jgi:hypothetical protein
LTPYVPITCDTRKETVPAVGSQLMALLILIIIKRQKRRFVKLGPVSMSTKVKVIKRTRIHEFHVRNSVIETKSSRHLLFAWQPPFTRSVSIVITVGLIFV